MREAKYTSRFKKQVALMAKRGLNMSLLDNVIKLLVVGNPLPRHYCDNALKGKYVGLRECHIQPDWLLVYQIDDKFLTFIATGTHSDLFD